MGKYYKGTDRLRELAGLKEQFSDIHSDIAYRTDGPVTKHVAIYRALQLARKSNYDIDDIASELQDVLDYIDENGDIPSNEY